MWLDTLLVLLLLQLKQSPFGTTYIDGASLEKLHFALPNQAVAEPSQQQSFRVVVQSRARHIRVENQPDAPHYSRVTER